MVIVNKKYDISRETLYKFTLLLDDIYQSLFEEKILKKF